MARKIVRIGTSPNDGTGDSLRETANKINFNFAELYTALGLDGCGNYSLNIKPPCGSDITLSTCGTGVIKIGDPNDPAITVPPIGSTDPVEIGTGKNPIQIGDPTNPSIVTPSPLDQDPVLKITIPENGSIEIGNPDNPAITIPSDPTAPIEIGKGTQPIQIGDGTQPINIGDPESPSISIPSDPDAPIQIGDGNKPIEIGNPDNPAITIPSDPTDPIKIGDGTQPVELPGNVKVGDLDPWHIVHTDAEGTLSTSDQYRVEPILGKVTVKLKPGDFGETDPETSYTMRGGAVHLKAKRYAGQPVGDSGYVDPDVESAVLYFTSTVTDQEMLNGDIRLRSKNASKRHAFIAYHNTPAISNPQQRDWWSGIINDANTSPLGNGSSGGLSGIQITPWHLSGVRTSLTTEDPDVSGTRAVSNGLCLFRRERVDYDNHAMFPQKTRMTLNCGGTSYEDGGSAPSQYKLGWHLFELNDGAISFHESRGLHNKWEKGSANLLIEAWGISTEEEQNLNAPTQSGEPSLTAQWEGKWVSQYSAYERTVATYEDLGEYASINEPVTYFGFSVKPTNQLGQVWATGFPSQGNEYVQWAQDDLTHGIGAYNPDGTKLRGDFGDVTSLETWERIAAHPIVAWSIDRKVALRGAKWEKANNIKGDIRMEAESELVFSSETPERIPETDYGTGLFFPDSTRQYTAWRGAGNSIDIVGTPDEVEVTRAGKVYTVGLPDDVVITGNLTTPNILVRDSGVDFTGATNALYFGSSANRVTLANYNAGGKLTFEVNGGSYTAHFNADGSYEFTNLYARPVGASGRPISVGSDGIIGYDDRIAFNDTVFDKGNIEGNVTFNRNDGTIQRATAVGNFTVNLSNVGVGRSITLIITQDGTGGRTMTPPGNMKFAEGYKTLSTAAGAVDMMNIFYDGSTYYCTLTTGYA